MMLSTFLQDASEGFPPAIELDSSFARSIRALNSQERKQEAFGQIAKLFFNHGNFSFAFETPYALYNNTYCKVHISDQVAAYGCIGLVIATRSLSKEVKALRIRYPTALPYPLSLVIITPASSAPLDADMISGVIITIQSQPTLDVFMDRAKAPR